MRRSGKQACPNGIRLGEAQLPRSVGRWRAAERIPIEEVQGWAPGIYASTAAATRRHLRERDMDSIGHAGQGMVSRGAHRERAGVRGGAARRLHPPVTHLSSEAAHGSGPERRVDLEDAAITEREPDRGRQASGSMAMKRERRIASLGELWALVREDLQVQRRGDLAGLPGAGGAPVRGLEGRHRDQAAARPLHDRLPHRLRLRAQLLRHRAAADDPDRPAAVRRPPARHHRPPQFGDRRRLPDPPGGLDRPGAADPGGAALGGAGAEARQPGRGRRRGDDHRQHHRSATACASGRTRW